jgi:hypothetical protein
MNLSKKRYVYWLFGLMAIAVSACGAGAPATPDGLSGVYTSAAETLTAQAALPSLTPYPSLTPLDTLVPVPTFTDTPDVSSKATPTPTSLSYPTAVPQAGCDNSAYVSDITIPDHTVIVAGATFQKTWAMLNTGTCTWTTSYKITFVSGDQMGGAATALTGSVTPGQQANISVALTAPTKAGEYTGYWRLANDQGVAFGQKVYVLIDSSTSITVTPTLSQTLTGSAVTQTPSRTPTGPAVTKTPSRTAVGPTATGLPSSTPTSPAPTSTPSPTLLVPTPTPTFTLPAPTDTPTPTSAPPTLTPTATPT